MIRAALVTHGRLGEMLVNVVETFLGPQHGITVISNNGLSAAEIQEAVRREIDGLSAADRIFLFSDLGGGSCDAACRNLATRDPRCYGFSGVNLPMLLEFCHYRARLGPVELAERVVRKGRSGIQTCFAGEAT
jgi:mannose/fructose-specific phosphotransferase system component IIA